MLGSLVHRVDFGPLPLGLLLGLALSAVAFGAGGLVVGGRTGAAAAAAGWFGPVLLFSTPRHEGDLLVASGGHGMVWLLGGTVLAGLSTVLPYAGGPTPTAADPAGR